MSAAPPRGPLPARPLFHVSSPVQALGSLGLVKSRRSESMQQVPVRSPARVPRAVELKSPCFVLLKGPSQMACWFM